MQPPQGPYQQNADSSYYPPQQPAQPQWTQMPLPNQGPSGQMPGQVPPPAQMTPPPGQQIPYQGNQPMAGFAAPGNPYQNPYQNPQQMPPQPQMYQQPHPQQGGYQTPKTGMPRPKQKKKKGGYIILALVVVALAAFIVLRMIAPGQTAYGYVQSGSLSARYTGDAVVVRNETVFAQDGVSQIEYEADEGAQVKRGANVATIYTSGFSAKEWTTLDNYRNQIKEYHKVLISEAASDTKLISLMSKVRERALEAQKLVQGAKGSLGNQEALLAAAMQDQRIYMKQKYPDDQKLSRLYDDENNQMQRISTWTKQYAAPADGLVSFYTDGFETALNMTTYESYSPTQMRSIYNGTVPDTGATVSRNSVPIYRLVRQEPWVVLMLCNELEWTPVTGRSYKLLIESFDNTIVDATVESFTRSGGELLVRLRIEETSALSNVLYIRSCKVQLGESVNTLMVPSRAIYIQEGRKGVVMTTEGGEYWTGVEVISDDGTVAYVIPENPGVLYEGIRVRLF
ncbi:MAG: hypothetical protein IJE17_11745 [Clostridia bacterium]|nr:hypothetical protein [Clostridia bacterium]MBQ6804839.1 hypothetical protein [Clostridia bacterium]